MMEKKSRLYLSGPVTGNPDFHRDFDSARELLERQGYRVISPIGLSSVMDDDAAYEEYMQIDLELLAMCDAIVLLPGWEKSPGANRELGYALGSDRIVLHLEDFEEMEKGKAEESGWIPVLEAMPEEGEPVLISECTEGLRTVCKAWHEGGRWWTGISLADEVEEKNVPAWMPLPSPYRGRHDADKAKAGWIPADQPPKAGEYVLISFSNFSLPMVGRYEADGKGGAYYAGDEEETLASQDLVVNAWMPLPANYREEDEA